MQLNIHHRSEGSFVAMIDFAMGFFYSFFWVIFLPFLNTLHLFHSHIRVVTIIWSNNSIYAMITCTWWNWTKILLITLRVSMVIITTSSTTTSMNRTYQNILNWEKKLLHVKRRKKRKIIKLILQKFNLG